MKAKQIRVLFDHQVFSLQNYGGITAYYEWLLPKLKKYSVVYKLPILVSSNYHISKIKQHFYINVSDNVVKKYLKYVYFLINSAYTTLLMKFIDYDIYHATYYEPSFLRFLGNKKLVITIYDCAYEEMGSSQSWTKRIIENRRKLIERADRIIAISNDVKKDIVKYYGTDPNKIRVTYLFSPLGNKKIKKRLNRKNGNKYILYIGTREFNKNFIRFVQAYKKLNDEYQDVKLLCLGGGKFTDTEIKLFNKLEISDRVDWKYFASDNDTIKYLQNALIFVYPSLKEGFGIPLLNAFACGCPVVASDIPVFKEIAEGAFVPFKPVSVENMYVAMSRVIGNKINIKKYITNGYLCVKKYSIDRLASETSKLYYGIID